MAFFDVRVLNPNAKRYVNEEISKTCEVNEKEKRSLYNKRNIEIEHGSFTPLLMTGTTRMVQNAARFTRAQLKLLARRGVPVTISLQLG